MAIGFFLDNHRVALLQMSLEGIQSSLVLECPHLNTFVFPDLNDRAVGANLLNNHCQDDFNERPRGAITRINSW